MNNRSWRLLAVGLILVLCAAWTTSPATAVARVAAVGTGDDRLAVTIDALAPVVPHLGETLTLSGTVTNTGVADVRLVSVRLRVSPTGLSGRSEIAEVVSGKTDRTGNPVPGTDISLTDVLVGGGRVPFTISVPIDSLGLSSSTPSVQILGVEALGDAVTGDGSGPLRLGLTRTFLPWFPDPTQVKPTRIVWLWPLADAPARNSSNVQLTDATGIALAPGGRLRRLLDVGIAGGAAITWVSDPALLDTAATMVSGYQVQLRGAVVQPGTHAPAATRWLADLRANVGLPTATVLAVPSADPDVAALSRGGLDIDIIRAATTASDRVSAVLGRAPDDVVGWPAGGFADAASLDALQAAGVHTVVLDAAALPPTEGSSITPDGITGTESGRGHVLLGDTALSALVASPQQAPGTAILARQQFLAEAASITLEAPSVPRTVVVAPPVRWAPNTTTCTQLLAALKNSPWMASVTLADLLAAPAASGTTERRRADYPPAARDAELSPNFVQRIANRRAQVAALRSITVDTGTDVTTERLSAALSRTESAAWRKDRALGQRFLAEVGREVDEVTAKVRVLSKGTVTFPGESGIVPVTIANDLDRPVRVGLVLTGEPSVKFEAKPYPAFTVAPGAKFSVEVPARVLGTTDVEVTVQITTSDGLAFGTPGQLSVRSTAYARAAAWVVGGLFAILVALMVANFVRRRRIKAKATGRESQ